MISAPAITLMMVMAWGSISVGPQEIPAAEAPPAPAAPERAVAPPASLPSPVSSSPRSDSYWTPSPPPVTAVESPGSTEVRWYGWQLLLADLGSIVAMAKVGTPVGIGLGIGGLVLGAPVLHAANHNYGHAAASLAVRGGVLLLIASLAADEPPPCPKDDPICPAGQVGGALVDAGVAIGLLLGGVVFAIVDDTALAHVRVERPARGVSGFVAPQAGGVSVGLGGKF